MSAPRVTAAELREAAHWYRGTSMHPKLMAGAFAIEQRDRLAAALRAMHAAVEDELGVIEARSVPRTFAAMNAARAALADLGEGGET